MEVYIYYLRCPKTKEIRYVGRTRQELKLRLRGHITKSRNSPKSTNHKNNWIKSILSEGLKPTIEYVETVYGWADSHLRERQLINEMLNKGFRLVNSDDRGEGSVNKVISDKQKRDISNTLKKRYKEGLKVATCIPLHVYNLNGDFIKSFESMTSCAKWLKISDKHIQISIRRNSRRLKGYQIRRLKTDSLPKYINPKYEKPMPE